MFRRTYLLLLVVRIYFAFSPSYLHPDENFQGPEIFAGQIFNYPSKPTWEFTSDRPIRSVFPLWLFYGVPMTLLKWLWAEDGTGNTPPELIYYVLRGSMFVLSFVMEDWAIHELVASSSRLRRQTVVLVASSYVTWTFQTHTFSNSLETLLVVWSLVLIQRILENKQNSSIFACVVLSFLLVAGVFNRITFPAFVLIPGLRLVPHFLRKPLSLLTVIVFGLISCFIAIFIDTNFYSASVTSLSDVFHNPIITPLNNLFYNSDVSNLANHGLHPRYNHFLVNLPQLLGPIYLLLLYSFISSSVRSFFSLRNLRAISALSATVLLSIFPHQEPRFLIPCVALLLTCFRPPRSRFFLASWVLFNAALGILMGIYHQGGVIPTQLNLPTLLANSTAPLTSSPGSGGMNSKPDDPMPMRMPSGTATAFWWKTYSPPSWMLGDLSNTSVPHLTFSSISTIDLMGIPGPEMMERLERSVPKCESDRRPKHGKPAAKRNHQHQQLDPNAGNDDSAVNSNNNYNNKVTIQHDNPTLLIAPNSNTFLDRYVAVRTGSASAADADAVADRTNENEEKDRGSLHSLQLHLLWSYARHLNLDDMDFGEDGVWPTLKRVVGRRGLNVWLVRRRGCLDGN
ncbi:GPI mannosyltransferase [Histoplasma capsulatum G186AR]|uniref:Mannosyltransferase n=2 Tax=Ajellomyces capsulatus TaxID=5037 RepID=C0NE17_AJECG|nr:GPI mannosyltransferase [Histoplasma capsulatum G186AR]EEH10465.1 GPI mannosyltransferase [Histoplasma capsulatum G186AR]KAG5290551.1 GPI mannosyltransferase [Histoplasma capsulatum]QSS72479.1 GPI mannosyltransferase [Histoplasma capsulatum G186AR]